MSLSVMFWLLMVIAFLSWLGVWFVTDTRMGYVNGIILWICVMLLGWHAFGPPIHG